MPRIFDNIEQHLRPALQRTLEITDCAEFCVGYFDLRGWKQLDRFVERWPGGGGHCCRLLVGIHRAPVDGLFRWVPFVASSGLTFHGPDSYTDIVSIGGL